MKKSEVIIYIICAIIFIYIVACIIDVDIHNNPFQNDCGEISKLNFFRMFGGK